MYQEKRQGKLKCILLSERSQPEKDSDGLMPASQQSGKE